MGAVNNREAILDEKLGVGGGDQLSGKIGGVGLLTRIEAEVL